MSGVIQVVVVGAGITGLTLAYQLKKRYGTQIHVTVLEKSTSCGGWVQTDRQGGFLFERGPNSCRPAGGEPVLALIEELGLSKEVIHASMDAKKRYLYVNQQLLEVPRNPLQWAISPLTRAIFPRMLTEWSVAPSKEEESVHDWATRRFGKGVAEKFIDPLMRGIFAGNSRQLSMQACLPSLVALEKNNGSLTASLFKSFFTKAKVNTNHSPWVQESLKKGIFSLRLGWQQLVNTLVKEILQTSSIRTGCEVVSIQQLPVSEDANRNRNEYVELMLHSGERLKTDHVYVTTPAHATARLLEPIVPVAAKELKEIPFESVTLVQVGFNKPVFNLKGFGHLVPTWEDPEVMGMIWNSAVFPQQNGRIDETRLTIMLSGLVEVTEGKVRDILQRHLAVSSAADWIGVHKLSQAISQYTLGHMGRVVKAKEALKQKMPRAMLLGSSLDGIALHAAISQAHDTAWNLSLPCR